MSSFESSDASQVCEEFSSGHELQDEVEVSWILAKSFEINLMRIIIEYVTMKGCCKLPRMVFSLMTWSTYLSLMISAFLRLLRATYLLVCLFLASLTLPKEPRERNKEERL